MEDGPCSWLPLHGYLENAAENALVTNSLSLVGRACMLLKISAPSVSGNTADIQTDPSNTCFFVFVRLHRAALHFSELSRLEFVYSNNTYSPRISVSSRKHAVWQKGMVQKRQIQGQHP